MQTQTFQYKNTVLQYGIFKGGPKILIAFHGFGQTHTHFRYFSQVISEEFTVFSIDLFYHGRSIWPEDDRPLTKNFWKEIMETFLEQNGIEKFSLAGFSLGGKYVLATLEAFPEKTETVYLIAPDGIRTSFWYNFATYPGWARNYFKKQVNQPNHFFRLLDLMRKYQLMDPGILRFAHYQMSMKEKREKIYHTWVNSRLLKFNMRKIADLINKYDIKLKMFLGKRDKMMSQEGMQRLLKHLKAYDLEVLETDHYLLIDSVARHLQPKR